MEPCSTIKNDLFAADFLAKWALLRVLEGGSKTLPK